MQTQKQISYTSIDKLESYSPETIVYSILITVCLKTPLSDLQLECKATTKGKHENSSEHTNIANKYFNSMFKNISSRRSQSHVDKRWNGPLENVLYMPLIYIRQTDMNICCNRKTGIIIFYTWKHKIKSIWYFSVQL